VSDEPEGLIEETFITKLGAKYPWVKAKNCNTLYGIKFFPSVFCIDANGAVYSVPDDRMPDAGTIEKLLADVQLAPKLPEGAAYDPLRQMWQKGEYLKLRDWLDKALAQEKLDPTVREVCEAQKVSLQKRIDGQLTRVAQLGQGPDYAGAADQLAKVEKKWKGLPPADAARKEIDRFAADATIKKELAAGRALQKLLGQFDTSKQSQAKKLVGELMKFEQKNVGTHAAKIAEQQRLRLSGG
jgi:hypothetical protein